MPDEPTPAEAPVTTEVPASAAPTETPTAEQTPAATTPDWKEIIATVDPKELRSHERIAGIVGNEIQRAVQTFERNKMQELTAKARRDQEDELIKAVEDNADYFKEHYPKAAARVEEIQKQRALEEVQGMQGKTVSQMADLVGRAVQNVPEWAELTDADFNKLRGAMKDVPDHEAIAAFNKGVIDLVAEKRAEKKHQEWTTKELAKERAALKNEIAAEMLKESEAPDMTRPKGQPQKLNPKKLTPEEFDKLFPPNVPLEDSIRKNFGT